PIAPTSASRCSSINAPATTKPFRACLTNARIGSWIPTRSIPLKSINKSPVCTPERTWCSMSSRVRVAGIPSDAPADIAAVLRSRLIRDVSQFLRDSKISDVDVSVGTGDGAARKVPKQDGEMPVDERSRAYAPADPLWTLSRLIVPQSVRDELMTALHLIRVEAQVFDNWGLRKIEPFPP